LRLQWRRGADAIITGDKDLLRMGVYDSVRMLRVGDFSGRMR
jgi:predicted nucleic acid-binding protein